jgi:hypothetical protein
MGIESYIFITSGLIMLGFGITVSVMGWWTEICYAANKVAEFFFK